MSLIESIQAVLKRLGESPDFAEEGWARDWERRRFFRLEARSDALPERLEGFEVVLATERLPRSDTDALDEPEGVERAVCVDDPRCSLYVRRDGAVFPCTRLAERGEPLGSLSVETAEEIWSHPTARRFRERFAHALRSLDAPGGCEAPARAGGVRGLPPPEVRPRAGVDRTSGTTMRALYSRGSIMRASGTVLFTLTAIFVVAVAPYLTAVADEAAPPAGTMRFSTQADAFPANAQPTATGDDTIYALCGFGKPWRELMSATDKDTAVVVKLYEGNTQKRSATFRPGAAAFEKDTFVLEIVPDPETSRQFPYFIVDSLAKYPVGKHALTFELWSFAATTKDRILGRGTLTFVQTETGRTRLAALVKALKDARKRHAEAERAAAAAAAATAPKPEPEPEKPLVKVRHEGADFLQLRGDEIVKDGAVVGSFDGTTVRKGGSIVGEIKGEVFRHEGSEKWKLDRGNMYSGLEIRWEGAIIGSIEKTGRITWEGSEWGNVKPYAGTPEETMRIFAALYYFSTYFQRK